MYFDSINRFFFSFTIRKHFVIMKCEFWENIEDLSRCVHLFFLIFKTSIVFVLRIGGLSIYYLCGINLGHVQGFSTGYWTYRLGRGWWNFLVCFSSLIVINTCAHRYCFLVFHNALHFCTIMLSLNVPREKYTCRI